MRHPAAPTKGLREPPAPPAPPPGRVVRETFIPQPPTAELRDSAGLLKLEILILAIVGALAAGVWWAREDLDAWSRTWSAPIVQTSARLACQRPAEHETLLVYVNARPDGTVSVACGPAVSGPLR